MQRRQFLAYSIAGLGVAALAPYLKATKAFAADAVNKAVDELTLSNDEWKKRLTSEQYEILREEGTEAIRAALRTEVEAG